MTDHAIAKPYGFRSRRHGDTALTAKALLLIALVTWLGPALVMAVSGAVTGGGLILMGYAEIGQEAFSLIGLAVMTLMIGLFAVPCALLLGAWALRLGVAGVSTTAVVSAIGPALLGVIFDALAPTSAATGVMLGLTPIIVLHAATLWIATWKLCPLALVAPPVTTC